VPCGTKTKTCCKVGGKNMHEFILVRVLWELVALLGVLIGVGGGVGVGYFKFFIFNKFLK
jgi:hypothetical protein